MIAKTTFSTEPTLNHNIYKDYFSEIEHMNKKGDETKLWFTIWELIAIAAVIVVILVAIRGLANNSGYWKKYYSADMALMSDLENTNQGDFVVNYQLKDQNQGFLSTIYFLEDRMFEVVLKPDRFIVYDSNVPNKDYRYGIQFPFAKAKDVLVAERSLISKFIVLSKIGSELNIADYNTPNTVQCPSFNSRKDVNTLIFQSISLDQAANSYSKSLQATLDSLNTNNQLQKNQDSQNNEASVLLAPSDKSDEDLKIFYYSKDVNSIKSQKLACIISKRYKSDPIFEANMNMIKYDSSLDSNTLFQQFYTKKNVNEYFVIISIPQKYLSQKDIEFSQLVKKSFEEYYN